MRYEINPAYKHLEKEILAIPERFAHESELIYKGRNVLKVLEVGGVRMCVKSFKKPHLINQVAYIYFRKSKAERSFAYASRFVELGVSTPRPVAYLLYRDKVGLTSSYYICLQEEEVCTLRGVLEWPLAEQEEAFRAFTRFTYDFQQKGIYFIDHSMGNTLVRREKEGFHFALVDLNRTRFMPVSCLKGLKNLSMLELDDHMLQVIGEEYASLTGQEKAGMVKKLILFTRAHDAHVKRKDFIRDTRRMIKRRLFS